jgi:phosphoglycerol transferase
MRIKLSWWKTLAGYVVAGVVPVYVAMALLGMLEKNGIKSPLIYIGDALAVAMNIKGIIENGWYLTNDSLGMPDGMRMHDYPGGDNLCCFFLKLLGYITKNPFEVQTLFLLLTFGLTGVLTYAVLRRLRLSLPAALLGSLSFSLLPNHFYRGTGHLFYAAYFLIPPLVLVAIWVARDELNPSRRGFWRRLAISGLVVALLGSNGVYYPFFGLFILATAAGYGLVQHRKPHGFLIAASLVVLLMLSVVANQLPILLYLRTHGASTLVQRAPEDAEFYALKIVQLLLPIHGHRVPFLAAVRERYDSRFPLANENGSASMGLLGTLGLVFLIGWLLLRAPPLRIRHGAKLSWLAPPLATIAVACILFATVGGFSSLLSVTVFSKIRAYNRISPFIAFSAIAAAAAIFDCVTAANRRRFPFVKATSFVLATLLTILCVLDQTSPKLRPDRVGFGTAYSADHRFFSRVEKSMPSGAMIFQLPYMPFPEAGAINKLTDYLQFRGYLHTNNLRWSYGANKGRRCDSWLSTVAEERSANLLRKIVFAGFTGVEVSRLGYADLGEAKQRHLEQLTGVLPIEDERHEFVFFNISNYANKLLADYTPEEVDARRGQVFYKLDTEWDSGFSSLEADEDRDWRWASNTGVLQISHDAPITRQSRIQMKIVSVDDQPARLRIRSDFWNDDLLVNSSGINYDRRLQIPPGKHTVVFECDAKPARNPGDPRELVWRIDGFVAD